MRLHGDMRVQMIERAVRLFTTLPATLVHSLDFFVSASGPLVLLGTGNGNEGIDLLEPVRDATWDSADKRKRMGCANFPTPTYLSWTASCSDIRRRIWDASCGRLVWSLHMSWMSVLTAPAVGSRLIHSWWWVALILRHLVGLWVVGRVGRRVGRALLLLLLSD
jgi:hypothetical protein